MTDSTSKNIIELEGAALEPDLVGPSQATVTMSFFIPCYNEEANVIGAVDKLAASICESRSMVSARLNRLVVAGFMKANDAPLTLTMKGEKLVRTTSAVREFFRHKDRDVTKLARPFDLPPDMSA
jgi:hypothetical protein